MSRVQPGMPEHRGLADRIKTLEAQVARLSRARTMQSTSLDGGTFRVKGGGTIEILDASGNVIHQFDVDGMTVFEADGSTLMELDGTGIVLNDGSGNRLIDLTTSGLQAYELDGSTLAVIDGTGIRLNDGSGTKLIDLTTAGLKAYEADGSTLLILDGNKLRFNRSDGTRQLEITPAGGMKFYESDGSTVITTLDGSGLQVGSDVVIDSTGLEVIGGMVTPIWPDRASDSAQNQSLTTSYQTIASITFTPPSWVERIYVFVSHHSQMTDADAKNLLTRLSSSAGSTFAGNQFGVGGSGVLSTNSSSISDSVQVDAVDFPYTLNQQARVNSGTNSSNVFTVSGIAFGIRVP